MNIVLYNPIESHDATIGSCQAKEHLASSWRS